MSTTDIVVFVGVAAAAAMLLRLASANKPDSAQPSVPAYLPPDPLPTEPPQKPVPPVGHELGLPFDPDLVAQEIGAGEDRPTIQNYFFKRTRLDETPPDPHVFLDDFTMLLRTVDGHRFTAEYTIATPEGLRRLIDDKHYKYIQGNGMLIFPRYDLDAILRAVTELQFAAYSDDPGGEELIDSDETSEPATEDDDRR